MKVKDKIEKIKKQEKGKTHQIYVCIKRKINDKHISWRYPHLLNDELCYEEKEFYVFPKNEKLEYEKEIIDIEVKKQEGDLWGFNGRNGSFTYNEYFLIVNRLVRNNKGNTLTLNKKLIPFTKDELKGRRFTL